MKNTVIFVASNSAIRGLRLATKAGFFYVPAKGVFLPIKRRLAFTERLRNVYARESGLFDSGIRQAAFSSAKNVKQSHNAHRNHNATGTANALQRAANHPASQRQTRGEDARRLAPLAPVFEAMTDEQIEAAFKKLAATVRFYWAKRGILFNANR